MGVDLKLGLCTAPNQDIAEKLASHFVTQQWAACVNIIPHIQSIYQWEGNIEKESEVLMLVKTNSKVSTLIQNYLDSDHPYDCPEWIELDIDTVKESYGAWVLKNLLD